MIFTGMIAVHDDVSETNGNTKFSVFKKFGTTRSKTVAFSTLSFVLLGATDALNVVL